ncbi:hypothetical protein C8F04DRAFT_1403061 [Mycena alexandri]|uniref:Uncharacterized protein n=1 Tax=Mycena alexandri TaxID=1745969 RepID=A0AAD6S556_9AGAR|nr:hypothetical protein C8F04DRAFT_1403061 [Mycena alexandri]
MPLHSWTSFAAGHKNGCKVLVPCEPTRSRWAWLYRTLVIRSQSDFLWATSRSRKGSRGPMCTEANRFATTIMWILFSRVAPTGQVPLSPGWSSKAQLELPWESSKLPDPSTTIPSFLSRSTQTSSWWRWRPLSRGTRQYIWLAGLCLSRVCTQTTCHIRNVCMSCAPPTRRPSASSGGVGASRNQIFDYCRSRCPCVSHDQQ